MLSMLGGSEQRRKAALTSSDSVTVLSFLARLLFVVAVHRRFSCVQQLWDSVRREERPSWLLRIRVRRFLS